MIKRIIRKIFPKQNPILKQFPVLQNISGAEISVIVPAAEAKSKPTDRLFDVSMQAVQVARKTDHSDIVAKMIEFPHWPNIYPGEHYKLLTGLVTVLQPKLVIEIGTATGYSSLAMKKVLPPNSKIVTFDIVPWKEFPKCILQESDFSDGRLVQEIADLTNKAQMEKYRSLLEQADFVFVDAAKDGIQEQVFLDNFGMLNFTNNPIFMFDDIRVINMIQIWHDIKRPKLDVTCYGHWAGTGLIDWTA